MQAHGGGQQQQQQVSGGSGWQVSSPVSPPGVVASAAAGAGAVLDPNGMDYNRNSRPYGQQVNGGNFAKKATSAVIEYCMPSGQVDIVMYQAAMEVGTS